MKKNKISWGILSTAKIARTKVIPAMQNSEFCQVNAIASRNMANAQKSAKELSIPKAYGSYKELLADKEIEAVYIPLPNHMHIEWIEKSLEAGKHVLCEKPIGLNAEQTTYLLELVKKHPELKVMEAFMFRFHPRWEVLKKTIQNDEIGEIKNIHSVFTYHNTDPNNIRNKADIGGGSLLDVGCYCISLSRFLYKEEPIAVNASIEYDPVFKTDRLVSGILQFKNGTASFTCSTQLSDREYADVLGTKGRIEIPHPFIPDKNRESKLIITKEDETKELLFAECDQYTLQVDAFSQAILNNTEVPTPLDDAQNNLKVIDALFQSGKEGTWTPLN